MFRTEKYRKDAICLIVLYLCYFLALLMASFYTSPVYPHCYGDDSALFALLGRGILQGRILYTDLFDHKGPVIFFINALGQLWGGYSGIFSLQVISGIISLTFLYYSAKIMNVGNRTVPEYIINFVFAYIVFFYTFEGGNLTEEYSQPFISAALYLFIKYAARCEDSDTVVLHPPLYAFIYGIILAVLAFLRLNNAATVCAGILAIFLYLLYKKEFSNLLYNILAGMAGMALVVAPICTYFWKHSALYDMIYATFLYNLNIVGNSGQAAVFDHLFNFFVLYLPIIICCILFLIRLFKKTRLHFIDFLFGCILLFNILVLYLANRYAHYFVIFVPVYLVFLFRYFHCDKKRIITWLVIFCAVANLRYLGIYSANTISNCYITKVANKQYTTVQNTIDLIPESERTSVIGYQIPVSYYIMGDIIPCYKYYTWQESWSKINPQILTDFFQWIRSEQPLWLLVSPGEARPELIDLLHQQYDLVSENDCLAIYRLKKTS